MKKSIIILAFLAMQSVAFAQKKNTGAVISDPASKAVLQPAIDLKAMSITFTLIRRIDDNKAIIKVIGTIKNVGTQNYVSRENQQGVNISEVQSSTFPNAVGPTKVKVDRLFSTIPAGGTYQISYEMEWNKSNEFPPIFVLNITFDPDIRADGNTSNDDAVFTNNKLEVDGKATVNAMRW